MKKIKLLFLMLLIMILTTGCCPELYHDYEEDGNSPVSISTDDNRWFEYNQGIRIVTKGEDILLDYKIKENDDGTTTVILQIGEKDK